jgi:plasmid stability protein
LDAVSEQGLPSTKKGLADSAWLLLIAGRFSEGAASPILPCAINDCNAIIDCMASITIRRLPENTKRRLRIRAARNGRSMEQEARELLEAALARVETKPENIGEAIRQIFAPLGGVDLKLPPRGPIRDPGIK